MLKRKKGEEPASRRTVREPGRDQRAFSYYEAHSARSSSSPAGNRPAKPMLDRRQWIRNLPVLVALLAVIFSVLYCMGLSNTPNIVISSLDASAVKPLRSQQAYQDGAQDILSQSFLSHTKLTVNAADFERTFLKKFPEVADVSINLPLISQQPVVTLVEARPALLLTSNGKTVVLDQNGKVIMSADSLLPAVRNKLVTVTDQSGLSPTLGKTVLPSTSIAYINTVVAQLAVQKMTPQSIVLPPQSEEMDVHLNGLSYFVKFDFTTDAREAVGAFLAVKSNLTAQHQTPTAYVDVRIAGRAYYK